MGKIEHISRERRRRGYIRDAVLGTIAVSGILLLAMTAPNVLKLLAHVPGMKKYRVNEKVRSALTGLAQKGLIVFEERGGKRYARITEKGTRALVIEQYKTRMKFERKPRWDSRWRIVMFDIPERRRGVRDHLRNTMRSLGFVRLQDSAWVFPYDCEDVIALLKADARIGSAVLYIIADSIENDRGLRENFGLH